MKITYISLFDFGNTEQKHFSILSLWYLNENNEERNRALFQILYIKDKIINIHFLFDFNLQWIYENNKWRF